MTRNGGVTSWPWREKKTDTEVESSSRLPEEDQEIIYAFLPFKEKNYSDMARISKKTESLSCILGRVTFTNLKPCSSKSSSLRSPFFRPS